MMNSRIFVAKASSMTLLTGATGFLGSHLLVKLLIEGAQVRAVVRRKPDLEYLRELFAFYGEEADAYLESLEWFQGDLLDVGSLEDAFPDVDEIFHCAAMVSFDPSDSQQLLSINSETTANVVNLSLDHQVRKMVYVSSVAALGRKAEGIPVNEESEWVESGGNTVYARSKYKAELEVWRGIQEGLNAVIVNPCVILGPGKSEQGSNAIFRTIANGFKFYSRGANAFVDVRDVADIMMILMKSNISGERFVLNAENLSYRELFDMMAESMEVEAPKIEASPMMSEVVWRLEKLRSLLTGKKPAITKETAATAAKTYLYDNQKVKSRLNFEFRPVKETVADMARFYQKHH